MPVLVALLRAVNVGPNNRMKMEALRHVFAEVGIEGAQTYLQSGNVVFPSTELSSVQLARRIEVRIEHAFGFHSDVILRSHDEIRRVIAENPFGARKGLEPAKLAVLFFPGAISAKEKNELAELSTGPEEIAAAASELYIYYPSGMGRSKLDAALGKALKTSPTARNWNSVTNIFAMMEKMGSESSDRRNHQIGR